MLSPINSGKILIDLCEFVDIDVLVSEYNHQFKELFIQHQLQINGYPVSVSSRKSGFEGSRLWFSCPRCGKCKQKIYKHPISGEVACRKCLNLEYSSRL